MTEYHTDNREARLYTTAISKGAAMLDETRRLLKYWQPEESLDEFAKKVHEHGLLGNATAYRTRDIVRRVFAPRFLRPTDKPAAILQVVLESGLSARTLTSWYFFYGKARSVGLRFHCLCFWPAVRRGRFVLDTDEVITFLSEAAMDGRLKTPGPITYLCVLPVVSSVCCGISGS